MRGSLALAVDESARIRLSRLKSTAASGNRHTGIPPPSIAGSRDCPGRVTRKYGFFDPFQAVCRLSRIEHLGRLEHAEVSIRSTAAALPAPNVPLNSAGLPRTCISKGSTHPSGPAAGVGQVMTDHASGCFELPCQSDALKKDRKRITTGAGKRIGLSPGLFDQHAQGERSGLPRFKASAVRVIGRIRTGSHAGFGNVRVSRARMAGECVLGMQTPGFVRGHADSPDRFYTSSIGSVRACVGVSPYRVFSGWGTGSGHLRRASSRTPWHLNKKDSCPVQAFKLRSGWDLWSQQRTSQATGTHPANSLRSPAIDHTPYPRSTVS